MFINTMFITLWNISMFIKTMFIDFLKSYEHWVFQCSQQKKNLSPPVFSIYQKTTPVYETGDVLCGFKLRQLLLFFVTKNINHFLRKNPVWLVQENQVFLEGIFAQILLNPKGLLKPKGYPPEPEGPRPEGHCAALYGGFQNPRLAEGDLSKIPDKKPESCAYFFSRFWFFYQKWI